MVAFIYGYTGNGINAETVGNYDIIYEQLKITLDLLIGLSYV